MLLSKNLAARLYRQISFACCTVVPNIVVCMIFSVVFRLELLISRCSERFMAVIVPKCRMVGRLAISIPLLEHFPRYMRMFDCFHEIMPL